MPYVPHSKETRRQYEQLLLDISRLIPPGTPGEAIEEIAEEVLFIVCNSESAQAKEDLREKKKLLEDVLGTPLTTESFSTLRQYGKHLDDYVANSNFDSVLDLELKGESSSIRKAADDAGPDKTLLGMDDLLFQGQSSSDDSESDEDGKTTGKKTADRDFSNKLQPFAADVGYAFGDDDGIPEDLLDQGEPDDAEDDGNDDGQRTRVDSITFNEVSCNASYVENSLRQLLPTLTSERIVVQATKVIEYLSERSIDYLTLETQLTALLGGYDDEDIMKWIEKASRSRWSIIYGLRYASSRTQKEKENVLSAMHQHALDDDAVKILYQSITGNEVVTPVEGGRFVKDAKEEKMEDDLSPLHRIDLEACSFKDERSPHQFVRAKVPEGTKRAVYETHDEVILPPTDSYNGEDKRIPLSTIPEWAASAFPNVKELNPMQSHVFPCAFESDDNMLVCAPTGSGKTNVAMLTMLRAIANCANRGRSSSTDTKETPNTLSTTNLRDLKMVYVAPMKALVQEVVRTFSARLEPLGITVAELSGDSRLNSQQLNETQLIVTTPEKWDIVTRKSVELGVASRLKLLIIDEVHLLHNDRGPVLEAIVSRTLLQERLRGDDSIRLVGLSATLPNYVDVATFLQVNRTRGLFNFGASYRPIPLQQTFCAVKKIKGINQVTVMNMIAFDKVLSAALSDEQAMVFVHSRKETEHTAMYIMQRIMEEKREPHFVRPGSKTQTFLRDASTTNEIHMRDVIRKLLPFGIAIHHAGLNRDERAMIETLYAERHIRVLVCTSTLAWGVNLPANSVIIKGTKVFNPSKGVSELLSVLEVLQIFGRTGRLGFGSNLGKATIITSADDLHYYLSVLNEQLPIESQMMKRVVDMLNAEVSLGHIETTREGVQWLQRTYLYVRMRSRPELYGARPKSSDPLFLHHLENIIHTAAEKLSKCRMIEYDSSTRRLAPTAYGRIASHYYVSSESMAYYLDNITSAMHTTDLFHVFSMSSEFSNLTVRAEELAQIEYLIENAPVAISERKDSPSAKINILLQCYISRMSLQGLSIMSEMSYVNDSAQRILRAMYEICLIKEFGRTSRQLLELYLMVSHKQWSVESPVRQLRQFLGGGPIIDTTLRIVEGRRLTWEQVREWSIEDLAEKIGDERRAATAYEYIRYVPHFTLEASVRPLTRTMLYLDVDVTADFLYHEVNAATASEIILTVEHSNGHLLHIENVLVPISDIKMKRTFSLPTIVIPAVVPKPTHLFVRCASPHWLGTESCVALSLLNTKLPDQEPELLERHHRPIRSDKDDTFDACVLLESYGVHPEMVGKIFPFSDFFPFQKDLLTPIMDAPKDSIFAGIPPGMGKTVIAELFVLQFLLESSVLKADHRDEHGNINTEVKLLYITSVEAVAMRRYMDWKYKFGHEKGLGQRVLYLDLSKSIEAQMQAFKESNIIVTSGSALIPFVRKASSILSHVTHIIVDHLHTLRAAEGRHMEECVARLQSAPLLVCGGQRRARLLALSYTLSSQTEVCKWLKIPVARQYNYGTSYRQLRVRIEGLQLLTARSRYETSILYATKLSQKVPYSTFPSLIFVPTSVDAFAVARRLFLSFREQIPNSLIETPADTDDKRLGTFLNAGVGYMDRGTTLYDTMMILNKLDDPVRLPDSEKIVPLILVCAFDASWRLPAGAFTTVFVCCAERFSSMDDEENHDNRPESVDCTATELLQMVSRAQNEAIVYSRVPRRWVWSKLLNEPLPLESNLRYPEDFRDAINAAVAQGRAVTLPGVLKILQTHYFIFHLQMNLNFYNVYSMEDIGPYASEFARMIIRGLIELGCVENVASPGKENVENEEDPQNHPMTEEEDQGDNLDNAVLRPTVRGYATAYHCISMETLESVLDALETYMETRVIKLKDIWEAIALYATELSPRVFGDAARIADSAEYKALQTIARSLPSHFEVRSTDLDFSANSTKVYILLLARCAGLFYTPPDHSHSNQSHPFVNSFTQNLPDIKLLENIPIHIAIRLKSDADHLLSASIRVAHAMVELLAGSSKQARMTREFWPLACASMSLSHFFHMETWAAVKMISGSEYFKTIAANLSCDKSGWPCVKSLEAKGTLKEMEGTYAFVIDSSAVLTCKSNLAHERNFDRHSNEEKENNSAADNFKDFWWLSCVFESKSVDGKSTTLLSTNKQKFLSMRVIRAELEVGEESSKEKEGQCATYQLKGQLLFPIQLLESEDLDTITVKVLLVNQAFPCSAEAEVLFE